MERARFLRDIENEQKYAMTLEMAYLDAFNAVTDVGNRMYRDSQSDVLMTRAAARRSAQDRHQELRHVLLVMGMVLRDCADRRKRLADVAAGLSDVVLDKESPKR